MERYLNVNPMNLSDYLTVLDIVVTVLIGFVITHMVSVRDSRTRAIKDYYIQELTAIKSELNVFYSRLFKGESSAKEIIGWYSSIKNRVNSFDTSVRKTFKIYDVYVGKTLFANHKYITDTNDFNSSYSKKTITFSGTSLNGIGKGQKYLYKVIDQTLFDINNVGTRDYLSRKWLEFKSHYGYYCSYKKYSLFISIGKILLDWLNTHKSRLLTIMIVTSLVFFSLLHFGRYVSNEKEDNTYFELYQRFDSLNDQMRRIIDYLDNVPRSESTLNYYIQLDELSPMDTTIVKGWIKAIK